MSSTAATDVPKTEATVDRPPTPTNAGPVSHKLKDASAKLDEAMDRRREEEKAAKAKVSANSEG